MNTPTSRRGFLYTLAGTGAAAILAGCTSGRFTTRPGPDLVILNGMVLDGTGTPEHRLDVGIRNGMIVALEISLMFLPSG